MGRFSPTVLPRYYEKPGFGGHLASALSDVNAFLEERREKERIEAERAEDRELRDVALSREGIMRGQVPGPDVDVRAPVEEQVSLPAAFNPDETHPLVHSRRNMRTLRESVAQRDSGMVPGGAADELAGMFGTAAQEGRPPPPPPPPRVPPAGAYNHIRGTFEPAFVQLPTGGLQLDVSSPGNQRQLTENFYIDEDQTPEARKARAEAEERRRTFEAHRQFWIDRGESEESARLMATMQEIDPGIDPGDVLKERADEGEMESNRANWTAYNERKRALGEPPVSFDPSTNYAQQSIYLEDDLRGERHIRTRPTKADEKEPAMTETKARRIIDGTFSGKDSTLDQAMSAQQILGSLEYERLVEALTQGHISHVDVSRNQAKILAGKVDEVLGAAFTPRGPAGSPAAGGGDAASLAEQAVARYGSAETALAEADAAGGPENETDKRVYEILRQRAGR